ncbi:MAG: DUF2127 domain-containing protein [Acidiferrobacterales bacterium]
MRATANRFLSERTIHFVFRVILWVKGLFALTEIAGGVTAFFVRRQFLVGVASAITQGELAEDPHDLIANFLLHSAEHLSISTQQFTAYYLLSHGLVKLWLIVGLLRERLWYYPTALVVFGLFILYQLYRFDSTHSPWLLLITVIDLVVIALTWHEYRFRGRTLGRNR